MERREKDTPVQSVKVHEGVEAVRKIRDVLGPTDPSKAPPGSIRREFGQTIMVNAAHASDSTIHPAIPHFDPTRKLDEQADIREDLAGRLEQILKSTTSDTRSYWASQPEGIIEESGTPYFSFKDLDENKPSGSIRIRVETIDYFLRRYREDIIQRRQKEMDIEAELARFEEMLRLRHRDHHEMAAVAV